jgi:hypothetical protein
MVTLRAHARKPKQETAAAPPSVKKKSNVKLTKESAPKKKPKNPMATTGMGKDSASASSASAVLSQQNILQEFLSTRVDDNSKHEAITWLYNIIRDLAPELEPELQGKSTLAFGGFDYETKSKCSGRWFRIGIMVNKTGLSLMVSGSKDGKYLLEHYDKKQIGKRVSLGKSCIRFVAIDDLNQETLMQIIDEAAKADISSLAVS